MVSGEVSVDNDILVPDGVTLTLEPGTVLKIVPAENTDVMTILIGAAAGFLFGASVPPASMK